MLTPCPSHSHTLLRTPSLFCMALPDCLLPSHSHSVCSAHLHAFPLSSLLLFYFSWPLSISFAHLHSLLRRKDVLFYRSLSFSVPPRPCSSHSIASIFSIQAAHIPMLALTSFCSRTDSLPLKQQTPGSIATIYLTVHYSASKCHEKPPKSFISAINHNICCIFIKKA